MAWLANWSSWKGQIFEVPCGCAKESVSCGTYEGNELKRDTRCSAQAEHPLQRSVAPCGIILVDIVYSFICKVLYTLCKYV